MSGHIAIFFASGSILAQSTVSDLKIIVSPASSRMLMLSLMIMSRLPAIIASHVAQCTDVTCPCKDYCDAFESLAAMHPIVLERWPIEASIKDEAKGHTWVCADVDSNNNFSWYCAPCASSHCLRQKRGTYSDAHIGRAFKVGNLVRHQNTKAHADAVCEFFQLEPFDSATTRSGAPPVAIFREVFKRFVDGSAPDKGYELGVRCCG